MWGFRVNFREQGEESPKKSDVYALVTEFLNALHPPIQNSTYLRESADSSKAKNGIPKDVENTFDLSHTFTKSIS